MRSFGEIVALDDRGNVDQALDGRIRSINVWSRRAILNVERTSPVTDGLVASHGRALADQVSRSQDVVGGQR